MSALNALRRVQMASILLLFLCSAPLVLWRTATIAITFSFTRTMRASFERSTEEALKRTLRGVLWYRARVAHAVLTRADFNRAKARSSGTVATILTWRPTGSFPHGP